jgi:hypothetical protein
VVSALISLYLAFGCAVGSAALEHWRPVEALLGALAGLFGFAWLPLIGVAIIAQLCDTPPERKSPQ